MQKSNKNTKNDKKETPEKSSPKKESKKKSPDVVDINLDDINIDELISNTSSNDNSGNNDPGINDPSSFTKNEALNNLSILNDSTGANDTDTNVNLIKYAFANNENKPLILEKILSDGDSRIKEISTINTLNTQLGITKISILEQAVLDDISKKIENASFLSLQDELSIFATLNTAKEKGQKQIFDYIKMARDFNSMPSIYRQLVDKLMIMPDDKVPRLKVIPTLMELPDEIWNRIIEIVNLWNNKI